MPDQRFELPDQSLQYLLTLTLPKLSPLLDQGQVRSAEGEVWSMLAYSDFRRVLAELGGNLPTVLNT